MAKNLALWARFFLKNKKGGNSMKVCLRPKTCPLKERCLLGQICPGTLEDLKHCAPVLKSIGKGYCKYCGTIGDLFEINQNYKVCRDCIKGVIEADLLKIKEFSFSEVERILSQI